MPTNSKVDRCYQKVKKEGHSEASAARICQASTGTSLQTGRPPKGKNIREKVLPSRIKSSKLRGGKSCCRGCKSGGPCERG